MLLLGVRTDKVYYGPHDHPRRDCYWVENGMIKHQDTTTGVTQSLARGVFLRRLEAISDMVRVSGDDTEFARASELARHRDFVERGLELAKQAGVQQHKIMDSKLGSAVSRRRSPLASF